MYVSVASVPCSGRHQMHSRDILAFLGLEIMCITCRQHDTHLSIDEEKLVERVEVETVNDHQVFIVFAGQNIHGIPICYCAFASRQVEAKAFTAIEQLHQTGRFRGVDPLRIVDVEFEFPNLHAAGTQGKGSDAII
mmetsp:Transcript_10457/g.33297  ORF Transcript_10457/g.33297 Transcript_10457/m.33297 type:complete len:136 (-) Transcript_10457:158-565(-)